MNLSLSSMRRAGFVCLLFVLAFTLRFMLISKGPFHYDTLDLAICAQKTLATGLLQYEHGSGYPLTVVMGAVFIVVLRFFGAADPVFCVNVMSVFFGAAGVVVFFFFLEKLFDPSMPARHLPTAGPLPEVPPGNVPGWAGKAEPGPSGLHSRRAFYSAILLALLGAHVAISTFGKSLTLSIFFSLASAYFLLCYLKDGRRLCFFYAIAFLGFCAATRLSDLLVLAPLLYLLARYGRTEASRLRDLFVFAGLSLATAFIYYLPMLMQKGFGQFHDVLSTSRQASFLGPVSFIFPKSIAWLVDSLRPEGVLMAVCGLGFLFIHRRLKELVFLLLWFCVFQIFYGNVSSSGVRYLVIGWLPLLAAQGYFLGSYRGRAAYGAFVILLWLALAGFWRDLPAMEFRHRHALQADYARWVASKTPSDSVVIAVDEAIFLQFYTDREVVVRPVTCRGDELKVFYREAIDPVLAAGRRVFMVRSSLAYDECFAFRKTLKDLYRVKMAGIKTNEDWHHALLNQVLFKEELYELFPREEPAGEKIP
ncbi:MAG: hypothetical protein PHH75_02915 [Candidatus Omnitrophica bacterium]|nr:hypothetical protein [Candidatus Omnitrophota bacterium]